MRDPDYYSERGQRFRESGPGRAWDAHINALSESTQAWELELEGTMWNLACAMLDDFGDNGFPPDSEFRDYGSCFMWAGKAGLWPHGNILMAYTPLADRRYRGAVLDACGPFGEKMHIPLRQTMEKLVQGMPASSYNPNLGELMRELIGRE